ncbi:uncharacterized protein LOC141537457 [Cotesia typhae]|uniref:uncharacterized protein LOC141537457 n=1 Tax=Cotesia typhae TaxID=2053667 RepID=UPI003D68EDB0
MQYVIDFTGYYIAAHEFILKEYCIVPLEGFVVGKHDSHVVEPVCSFSKLSNYYKKAYLNLFYPKYGITWDDGDISDKKARESIVSKLVPAKVIYIKHAKKLNVLLKLLGNLIDPKKVVGLDDYGLNFSVETSTQLCLHHQDLLKNRCVVKNALTCAYWVSKIFLPENSKSNIESWKNKTAEELMEIGRSDKIGQNEVFDISDDSESDESLQRFVINLNIIKKKKESDDNRVVDGSNREDDSEFVDFDSDAMRSKSKDVDSNIEDNWNSNYGKLGDFDSENEDSMSLAEMQKLLKLDRQSKKNRKPGIHKNLESTLRRNSKYNDEKLDKKQAIVKLKKLDDSIFRKRYKFGKRLYLSELKL